MSDIYKRLTVEEFAALTFTPISDNTPYSDGTKLYKCEEDRRLDVYASKADDCYPHWISFLDPSVSVIPTEEHTQKGFAFIDDHQGYSLKLTSVPELWLSKIID